MRGGGSVGLAEGVGLGEGVAGEGDAVVGAAVGDGVGEGVATCGAHAATNTMLRTASCRRRRTFVAYEAARAVSAAPLG